MLDASAGGARQIAANRGAGDVSSRGGCQARFAVLTCAGSARLQRGVAARAVEWGIAAAVGRPRIWIAHGVV